MMDVTRIDGHRMEVRDKYPDKHLDARGKGNMSARNIEFYITCPRWRKGRRDARRKEKGRDPEITKKKKKKGKPQKGRDFPGRRRCGVSGTEAPKRPASGAGWAEL